MPIRKFGTEPANAEVRPEDNDPETLDSVQKQSQQQQQPVDNTRARRAADYFD